MPKKVPFITINRVSVKCDMEGCDWVEDISFDAVPQWHNKPCPKCHQGVIVTDAELAVHKEFSAIYEALKGVEVDEATAGPAIKATFDTSSTRT